MKDLKIYQLKVVNHEDIDFRYEVIDINAILASHDALCDFMPTLGYKYENERLYHIEKDSQDKVYNTAAALDPAHLLASDFAAYGAPITDQNNNVLGGNGRAMSVILANEKFTHLYNIYANKVREFAKQNNIACNSENPILIRKICQKITKAQGQALITALNDNFTSSKNKNADARSRGMRISQKTLKMLAQGLMQADSLREFFDLSDSLRVVKMLISDGVILESEKIEYINNEYLNSDGKTLIEKSLRSQIFPSYDCLMKMPAPMLAKIDAAIPFIIIAESIADYSIQDDIASACTMYAEYCGRTYKQPEIYLNQVNMLIGQAPAVLYGKLASAFFLYLLNSNKKEFVELFKRYASYATQSLEPLSIAIGIVKARQEAILAAFNVKIDTDIITSNQKSEISMSKQTSNQEIEIQKTENTSSEKREKKSGRKVKLDCDKQNSKLIASTTESVNVIVNKAHELIDNFDIIENGKTQSKLYIDGLDSGYRIIKSGRQWQLRLLNEYAEIQKTAVEIKTENMSQNEANSLQEDKKDSDDLYLIKDRQQAKNVFKSIMPADAKGVIYAELRINTSDISSDYLGYKRVKTVILGFSKHKRCLFSEMRKFAALYEDTKDLAGKGHEKRENYSCGDGAYIFQTSKYSGWVIKKEYVEFMAAYMPENIDFSLFKDKIDIEIPASQTEITKKAENQPQEISEHTSANVISDNSLDFNKHKIDKIRNNNELIISDNILPKDAINASKTRIVIKRLVKFYGWELKDNYLYKKIDNENAYILIENGLFYVNMNEAWGVDDNLSLKELANLLNSAATHMIDKKTGNIDLSDYLAMSDYTYTKKLETVISNIANNQSDIIENIEQTLIQADSNITVSDNMIMIDNEKPRQTTIISQCAIDDNKSDGTGLLSCSCLPLFAACMKSGADKRANKPQNNNPELLPVPKEKTQNKGIAGIVKRDKHYRRPYSQALSKDDYAHDNKRARIHEFRLLQ